MCHNSLGRPWTAPRALKGPLGSPWAPPRGPCVHNGRTKMCQHLPSICRPPFFLSFRATLHFLIKAPLQKHYKNKRILTVFEIAISVSFSYFCHSWVPEGPSWPTLGRAFGALLGPLAHPEISKQPPWSLWALPRVPFGLPPIGPRPKKTGLRQQRKTQFYIGNTMLLAKHGFETPPANDGHSFWALFICVLTTPWFLCWFWSCHVFASTSLVTSALDLHQDPPFCILFGPLGGI